LRQNCERTVTRQWSARRAVVVTIPLALLGPGGASKAAEHDAAATVATVAEPALAATFYVARMSGEDGWEDVLINPAFSEYVGAYLVAGALSRSYARYRGGALQLEAEGQIAYNFGVQDHWEFNAVPVMARWSRLPWSSRFASSAAFGLGFSYASKLPPVEVELEGESSQFLIYWVAELTAGPLDAPWAVSLRLHHRSVGYGLLGDEGGMNAVGIGVRYRF
jgi:hypothetical protein